MKKLLLLVLLVIPILLLTACGEKDPVTTTTQTTPIVTKFSSPRMSIAFNSVEDYEELKRVSSLSEEEFSDYCKNPSLEGVPVFNSASEVKNFIDYVENELAVFIPQVDKERIVSVEARIYTDYHLSPVYREAKSWHVIYNLDDGNRYFFATLDYALSEQIGTEPVFAGVQIGEYTIDLYRNRRGEDCWELLCGEINIGDRTIYLDFSKQEKTKKDGYMDGVPETADLSMFYFTPEKE